MDIEGKRRTLPWTVSEVLGIGSPEVQDLFSHIFKLLFGIKETVCSGMRGDL
jgi:hypothetical protein